MRSFLFIRVKAIFVKMKNSVNLILISTIVLIFACQNNSKNDQIVDDQRDHDTVAVVDLTHVDTSRLASFSVDSLKMCVAFQTAANEFTTGYKLKNIATYAKYSHPTIVKMNGGLESFKRRMSELVKSDTQKFAKMLTGPVKRVEAAIDPKGNITGWYCLMPVQRWPMKGKNNEIKVQWLAGQSLDRGKTIYFVDITGIPQEKIYQLMPDYHYLLDKELNR